MANDALFDRYAEIIIVDPFELEELQRESKPDDKNYNELVVRSAKKIIGLNFNASISDDSTKKGSISRSCQLKIFNLDKETALDLTRKIYQVRINAGYKSSGEIKTVFEGIAVKTTTKFMNSGDVETDMVLREANKPIREAYPTSAYTVNPNTTARSAVNQIAAEFAKRGVPRGDVFFRTLQDGNTPLGISVSEQSIAATMDEIAAFNNYPSKTTYYWNTVGGTFNFLPRDFKRGDENFTTKRAIRVKSNQLIGTLEYSIDLSTTETLTAEAVNQKRGVKFSVFLNPDLTTNNLIEVENTETGNIQTFNIKKVNHAFSLRGNDWKTSVECLEV